MIIRFCKDCANFEDRRDIGDVVLYGKIIAPHVCCDEFKHRNESINDRLYHEFCSECVNFEDVNETPRCAKNHTPRIASEAFVESSKKLYIIRQNNLIKTAVLTHTINTSSNPKPIPNHLIETKITGGLENAWKNNKEFFLS